MRARSRLLHTVCATALAGATLSTAIAPAFAFCGFYVAQANAKLFNKASKVVLAREGKRTVITMASDYEGDPKEFALVIPVPVVVQKDQIHVVDAATIDKLDAFTAPRVAEYHDEDPCRPPMPTVAMSAMPSSAPRRAMEMQKSAADLGVTVEAQYEVGVYDIVVLSAKESDGLVTWLTQNEYRIPAGANDVLGSYIRQNMHFFLAKVNLSRQAMAGNGMLKPIQVGYDSDKFMLPIRLGTVNANGPQDLVLYALTRNGRVEPTNYKSVKMGTNVDVPLFVGKEFGAVYKAAFERAVEKDGMTSVFLEYAWNLGWCDPCAGQPLDAQELLTLGAGWIGGEASQTSAAPRSSRMVRRGGPVEGFVTRLHVRYDRDHFPEDLALNETKDQQNFQVRYVLHHPWTGNTICHAADAYRRSLPARFNGEATTLAQLTGWDAGAIREKMTRTGQAASR